MANRNVSNEENRNSPSPPLILCIQLVFRPGFFPITQVSGIWLVDFLFNLLFSLQRFRSPVLSFFFISSNAKLSQFVPGTYFGLHFHAQTSSYAIFRHSACRSCHISTDHCATFHEKSVPLQWCQDIARGDSMRGQDMRTPYAGTVDVQAKFRHSMKAQYANLDYTNYVDGTNFLSTHIVQSNDIHRYISFVTQVGL